MAGPASSGSLVLGAGSAVQHEGRENSLAPRFESPAGWVRAAGLGAGPKLEGDVLSCACKAKSNFSKPWQSR